jgi:hypothetical protein
MESLPKDTKEHHKYILWKLANRIVKSISKDARYTRVFYDDTVFFCDLNVDKDSYITYESKFRKVLVGKETTFKHKQVWLVREMMMDDLDKIRKESV